MEIVTLDKVAFSSLTSCFNLAFSDYFVKFNATEEYLQSRWNAAEVDYSLSAGVIDGDEIVGFIVNAVRKWNGLKTAFNCGTGVVPNFRGRGLTGKMYDFLSPKLERAQVKCLALEVIQQNLNAIHVYEKVGLKIRRKLNCFSGEIKVRSSFSELQELDFKKLEKPHWSLFESFYEYQPAWENNNLTLKRLLDTYQFYGVFTKNKMIAFVVVNPGNGYVPQFGIHPDFRNQSIGEFLFFQLSKLHPTIKINNVDAVATRVLKLLFEIGLRNSINQYEMVSYL